VPGTGLGALAIAMADARGIGQPSSWGGDLGPHKSARNRKRALAKVARAVMEAGPASPSGKNLVIIIQSRVGGGGLPTIRRAGLASPLGKRCYRACIR